MPLDPRRVKALFVAALDLPDAPARAALLDRECGPDNDLRQRVERLLAAHDEAASESGPAPSFTSPLAGEVAELRSNSAGGGSFASPPPTRPGPADRGDLPRKGGGEEPAAPTIDLPPHTPTADLSPASPLAGESAAQRRVGGSSVSTADHDPAPDEGTVIGGRYKLLQQIGEGGMGTVWMAEQLHPVRRKVAVKLVKEGMDSRRVLARFEAERQALALMDHPHIAKVLDAGTTGPGAHAPGYEPSPLRGSDDFSPGGAAARSQGREPLVASPGRPYFVMELVKGVPLTQFCDAHRLTVPQRLELFQQICSAVQHAHQKGVIHRDLKPGNVLVESHDGKPVPKVIDFGLAKAVSELPLTDKSLFTAYGAVMGTPQYMAPEQAAFNAVDVDTRADIYALGVILYELLTGTPPIEKDRLRQAALDEVLRVIREEDPPTPSHRLSTAEGTPSVAANRQTEPKKLGRLVKGDLDWMVMKALSKDRNRRYETANGFAADVGRYLAGEPVLAVPPSAGYRLRKFVRRHKGQVVAAGLVLFALLAGIAGTTWGLVEAKKQERLAVAAQHAEAERAEGERLARLDAQANERLAGERLVQVEVERTKADAARVEAEGKAAEANAVVSFFADTVFAAARPKGQDGGLGRDVTLRDAITAALPALATGFKDQPLVEARLRWTLGGTFGYLGQPAEAVEQCERARALFTRHRGPDHPGTLTSMNNLALGYEGLGRHADALALREETLAASRRVLGPDHRITLTSMSSLAVSYHSLGRHPEALRLNEEVLTAQKRVLGPDHPDTLKSMINLALSYRALGRPADAIELREATLAASRRVLGPDHPDTLLSMNNLAASYADSGRTADALKLHEETLAARRRVLGPDHPNTLTSMRNLALSYRALGRPADSIKLFSELMAEVDRPGLDPRMIPSAFAGRLECCRALGDAAGCRATAAMWEKLGRPDANSLYDAACYRAVAAGVYAKKGQPAEAAADADKAMAWLRKAVAAGYRNRTHIEKDADLDALRGRPDFKALLATLPATAPPPREAKR
ncbi:MAG: serine/threonine-protein kinase [Gemmataceae bacterium]|nr:serine/threonine-protein kinase [Gemmataceae bacterium]